MTARRRPAARTALALLLGSLVLLGLLPPPPAGAAAPAGRVVVVGVPGLRWSDLSPAATPALWRLAARGAVGDLSIRSADDVTCPAAGWLQLGAGNRAGTGMRGTTCPADPPPQQPGAATAADGDDGDDAGLRRHNAGLDFGTEVGALAAALAGHRQCVAAAGPYARLGALPPTGGDVAAATADDAAPPDRDALARALAACPVVLAGTRQVYRAGASGAPDTARLLAADTVVAAAAGAVRPGDTLLVVGPSDTGRVDAPHLHVAIAAGPGWAGLLRSASTGRAPFVQLVDVAPTVLALRGVPQPAAMTGRPWRAAGEQDGGLAATVDRLVDHDTAALGVRSALPWFLGFLIGLQLLGYAAAAGLARRGSGRAAGVAAATGVLAAAGPLGSYLAQPSHWWRAGHPVAALLAVSLAGAVAVAAVAVAGPWRRAALGPPGAVAGLTALVLAADVVTGSRLQLSSVFGYSPLVAGRFVGFGNVAYGVFATAALLGAAALLPGRAARTAGVLAAAAGGLAVVVDGAPQWGSDFGGVLALVPAAAVLAMRAAGVRVSWRRALGVAALTVVAVAAFALVDYARPPSAQTHLGRFVGQVLHGGAWTVVRRKAEANLELVTHTPVNALVPFATAYLGWLVARPRGRFAEAAVRLPALRHGLVAVVVMAAIGFAVNDSGDAVPAMAMLVAIPYAVAAAARVRAAGPAGPAGPAAPGGPGGPGAVPWSVPGREPEEGAVGAAAPPGRDTPQAGDRRRHR